MELKLIISLFVMAACSVCDSQPLRNGTAQDSLDRADDMMQANDDFMNTIKLMMKGPENRKFKVENRMVFEVDAAPDSEDTGMRTLTVNEDAMPPALLAGMDDAADPVDGFRSQRPMPLFADEPAMMLDEKMMVGDVGLCKTEFDFETINTASLMDNPHGPKATLAHPLPVMTGRCKSQTPHINPGLNGKCVLAAQAHVAWVLVPVRDLKDFNNCVLIPGVSALQKCPTWILVGGRCVFHTQFLKSG